MRTRQDLRVDLPARALAGSILNALRFRVTPRAHAGLHRHRRIVVVVRGRGRHAHLAAGPDGEDRQVQTVAWDFANTVGVDAQSAC